jgi:hypothetical protein
MLAEIFVLHTGWGAVLAGPSSRGTTEDVGPVRSLRAAIAGGVIGAAVGVGFDIVSAQANAPWKQQRKRLPCAVLGGLIGGLFGGAVPHHRKVNAGPFRA